MKAVVAGTDGMLWTAFCTSLLVKTFLVWVEVIFYWVVVVVSMMRTEAVSLS
jgi:hypothetical protein